MGASGWDYVVSYEKDLGAALAKLRDRVFQEEDFYWPGHRDLPATIAELYADEYVAHSGTHSILDVRRVGDPDDDRPATVRPLSEAEVRQYFSTDHPTRDDFTRVYDDGMGLIEPVGERWNGCAVVLYRDGAPDEIAFWGISGD